MDIIKKLVGPKSKYEKSLPYTYEARVGIIEGDEAGEDYNSYISDTICSLVEQLTQKEVNPGHVEIFEIFEDKEKGIKKELYITEDGLWRKRQEMCQSFSTHYDGHIYPGGCTFQDRDIKGVVPIACREIP